MLFQKCFMVLFSLKFYKARKRTWALNLFAIPVKKYDLVIHENLFA